MSNRAMKALVLVEHVDRELDVVCLARMLLKRNFGIDLEVANVSSDAPSILRGNPPKIVFFSSFYSSEWNLRRDYVSAWPGAKFFSLSWEQIFCSIDLDMHRPLDDYARQKVHYLAWSTDYRDFLIIHGVDPQNITIVGHALYQLYDAPHCQYFKTRSNLAKKFLLDDLKRWIFIPENYGFAFYSDETIEVVKGGHPVPEAFERDLVAVRQYCRSSMAALGKWADALAKRDDVEVVFRPRPANNKDDLIRFFRDECGLSAPNFHLIKEETARDWVLASDVVLSSYSTVLIEAALAGKTIRKVEPSPLPGPLCYDWCELITSVTSLEDMVAVASPRTHDGGSAALREWAKARFFLPEDPVSCLVKEIAKRTTAAYEDMAEVPRGPYKQVMPAWLGVLDRVAGPATRDRLYRKFVPGYTHKISGHERDFFDRREVDRRTRKWREVIDAQR